MRDESPECRRIILAATLVGFVALAQTAPPLGVTLDHQGFPTLSWQVSSNWVYRIEATTNLISGPWINIGISNLLLSASNGFTSAKFLRQNPYRQFFRVRASPIRPFGAITFNSDFATAPAELTNLGASWARFNVFFDGSDQPFTNLLDAGLNLVITFQNRDPANSSTNYGTLAGNPHAGFPFLV